MKILFLILTLVSFNSWAGYVAGSKMNQCDRINYSLQSDCQESEKESCYKVPNDSGECGIFKLKDLYGTQKFDQESCEGQVACQNLLAEKVCGVGRHPLIDEMFTEVYCVEVIGKELVIDPVLKDQKDQEKAQKLAMENAMNQARKAMECGKNVQALLLVRNAPKQLTTTQIKEMVSIYAPIKQLLDTGSLVSAKEEIQAVTADGVLVTEADKTALTQEIDKCLGL